jgi:hypothetical protein
MHLILQDKDMKLFKITLLLFVILFVQCSNNNTSSKQTKQVVKEEKQDGVEKETLSFENFAQEFIQTINKENIFKSTLPAYGLYVLHNPGAFVAINNFANKEDFLSFSIKENYESQYVVQNGEIPDYSCEDDSWDKKGTYWTKDTFEIVLKAYEWMIEYELGEVDKQGAEYLNAQKLSKQETYCIYATDINVGFYFVEIDNTYYLYMLNLIEPCSA